MVTCTFLSRCITFWKEGLSHLTCRGMSANHLKMNTLRILVLFLLCFRVLVQCDDYDDEMTSQYMAKFRQAFTLANVSDDMTILRDNSQSIGTSIDCSQPSIMPSVKPTSVHRLSPYNVDVVAAMGDSVTAAMGAGANTIITDLIEYRGLSWSIGGDKDLSKVITFPNIIRQFNPNVRGFSVKTGGKNSRNAHFNVAVSGARARAMLGQAEILVGKFRDEGVTDEDWKVITLWIGGNDLCPICSGNAQDHADAYIAELKKALDYLSANVKRAYVNLVKIIDVTQLAEVNGVICWIVHKAVCDCATKPDKKELISEVARLYNTGMDSLIGSGLYDREDFTVVLQPFFSNTQLPYKKNGKPNKAYFAPDCFHFSKMGHGIGATYLWNNMLEPVGDKVDAIDWDNLPPLHCPNVNFPFFYTSWNSVGNVLNANLADSDEHGSGSSHLLATFIGVGVGVFFVVIAIVVVAGVIIRRRRRRQHFIVKVEVKGNTEKAQLIH